MLSRLSREGEMDRSEKGSIDGGLWKFYTEDSTGLKIGPVPAVDPSTVFEAHSIIPDLVTGKVAHDVTLELLKSIADEGTRWRLGASPQLLG
ncbi:hypothetical protein PRIPAC_76930, partial [Pristionchus pacificus]|uniref:Uncharacterized protein n=1 Tax=Pristionchus pacificus TaxID=54126 RepID=A0A2A6C224_PRIPA